MCSGEASRLAQVVHQQRAILNVVRFLSAIHGDMNTGH
jgi:hypothetical protein